MLKTVGKLGLAAVVVLLILPMLALIWLTFSDSEVGMTKDIGIQDPSLPACDYS